jgi:hypothetical protein
MGSIFRTSTLNCFRVNAKICATWCYIGMAKINSFYVLKSESCEPHVFKKLKWHHWNHHTKMNIFMCHMPLSGEYLLVIQRVKIWPISPNGHYSETSSPIGKILSPFDLAYKNASGMWKIFVTRGRSLTQFPFRNFQIFILNQNCCFSA